MAQHVYTNRVPQCLKCDVALMIWRHALDICTNAPACLSPSAKGGSAGMLNLHNHTHTSVVAGLLSLQVTSTNVDIARIAPKYHLYTEAEVQEVMSRL